MKHTGNLELVQEYVTYLRAQRGLSENTVSAYLTDLLQCAEIFEQRKTTLFHAGTDDVTAHIQHLTDHGIEKRSRARKIAALRGFYRWLIRNERIDKDPTRLTVLPKQDKLLPRPVDRGSMAGILERAGKRAAGGDSPYAIRNHAMLELLYGAGIRVSELCGIRQTDLALSSATVIVKGKGSKERVVPIGAPAVAAIDNYIRFGRPHLVKSGKEKALFISDRGKQITRQWVYAIAVAAGGEDEHTNPHRLRHSCATDFLSAGADLRQVQELLGHANLGTTQIYTQVSKDALQNAHARFHPRG